MESKVKWISVKEKLPTPLQRILFATKFGTVGEGIFVINEETGTQKWYRLGVEVEPEYALQHVVAWCELPKYNT